MDFPDLVRGGALIPSVLPTELPPELPTDPPDLVLAAPIDLPEPDLDTRGRERDGDLGLGASAPDELAATTSGCSVDILAVTLSEKQKSRKAGFMKIRYTRARQGQGLYNEGSLPGMVLVLQKVRPSPFATSMPVVVCGYRFSAL